ncbi:MAG: YbaK/EbsC family protein [Desulfobacteraceae bacterium]
MTTRGIRFLKQNRIPHLVVKYHHTEKGAEFAARAVDFPLARTVKTLVVALDSNRFALVLVAGDRQLSMKKVARVCKAKRAAMADTATAQRLTGYQVGGISPFGTQKKELGAVMDASLTLHQEVMINAGQRGIMVKISPGDIVKTLKPAIADLSA